MSDTRHRIGEVIPLFPGAERPQPRARVVAPATPDPKRERIPMPPELADALRTIGSTDGAAKARGRIMTALFVVANLGDHVPPEWPAPIGIPWLVIEEGVRSGSAERTSLYRAFVYRVTTAESHARASVVTLLRAWRDIVDHAAGDPAITRQGERIRNHLELAWKLRIEAPPATADASSVAERLTRQWDLLPRDERDLAREHGDDR